MNAAVAPPSQRPPKARSLEVFEVLSRSRATLERRAPLGDALLLAQWHNERDSPSYHCPGHHTLSVYLEGGQGTRLVGRPHEPGAPGRHCVLPAEHESHWQVDKPFRFLHLYVSELAWSERVVRLLDAEPRAITLEPCIFGEDNALSAWAAAVARLDWNRPADRLQANALSHAALDQLVLRSARPRARQAAQRPLGGLSTAVRRRVLEHIDAGLDGALEPLSVGRLAALAHLSEYHFARMFRVSMGCSVQSWVTQRRMARAQALLARGRLPLAQVAQDCGLGSASQLNRLFRQQLGATPLQYRQACAATGAAAPAECAVAA
ncbi:helix-turn-helix transcriptional regulator [Hydrogenophaga palleronii]|uniref:helix-turn-helix transcriptional regulator n=1 Tax=Hydrogenophaga palleronii TaxID=65655 RepID=UPI0008252621|nr:helix-turn-helix transcriptional regulator [Hydrogenophaga palleronii]